MKNIIKVKAEFDIVVRPTNHAQFQKLKEFQMNCNDRVCEAYVCGAKNKVRLAIEQCINDFEQDVLTEVKNCHIEAQLVMEGDML